MTAPVIVTMRHVRAAGYCSAGLRAFVQRHDLDLGTFLRDGIPADLLEATGDALAQPVCALARAEAGAHG